MTEGKERLTIFQRLSKPTKLITPIQSKILKTLDERGPLARRELVMILERPRSTIYDNLAKLEKRKLVERALMNNGEIGRPLTLWRLKE